MPTKTNPKMLFTKNRMRDFPIDVIAESFKKHVAAGRYCYQKFTCAGCGNRLTCEQPNTLYRTGTCDNCDCVTEITACNFLLSTGPLP